MGEQAARGGARRRPLTMLMFVEYIARPHGVSLERFHKHAKQDWPVAEDVVVANLARMNKLGPEPHYMCWWGIKSLARIDEWRNYYVSEDGRRHLANSRDAQVLDFQRHGIFDIVMGSGIVAGGLHIAEFFDADALTSAQIQTLFQDRNASATPGRLDYVLKRLGMLAPEPGGIALWSFPTLAAAEPFLRAPIPTGELIVSARGVYRPMGEEGT